MGIRKIAVVGAGVIGLSTALQVQRTVDNVSVTVFADNFSPGTTGDVSAGLWMPYLLQDTPQDLVTRWSNETQKMILDLWRKGKAKEAGICLQPILRLAVDDKDLFEDWTKIALGFSKLKPEHLNKLSEHHRRRYKSGMMMSAFTLEPAKFLPYIETIFLENGGKLVRKKIDDLDELFSEGFEVVVNCSGLSSKNLAEDRSVRPVRGQIARVEAPWQYHVMMDESDDGGYVIPNAECVILGGTHQEDDYSLEVDPGDKEEILGKCYGMVPSLKNANIIKHQVGLRPGRPSVRLEIQLRKISDKGGKSTNRFIVHNYGHGGSGVTLCQGCAVDATNLVRNALRGSKL